MEVVALEEGLFLCHLPPLEAGRGIKGHKVGGGAEEKLLGSSRSSQIVNIF